MYKLRDTYPVNFIIERTFLNFVKINRTVFLPLNSIKNNTFIEPNSGTKPVLEKIKITAEDPILVSLSL